MNCVEVQPKLREYLDDLLPEQNREQIRSHLSECRSCYQHSLTFGSFAGDLKKLAEEIPVPEDLTDSVWASLKRRAGRQIENAASQESSKKRIVRWTAGALVLLAAGLFFYRLGSSRPHSPLEKAPGRQMSKGKTALPTEQPLTNSPGQESQREEAPRPKAPVAISLHPLHWHLKFSSGKTANNFWAGLRGLGIPMEFEAAGCGVLSADKAQLSKILDIIAQSGAVRVDGLLVRMKKLPDFEGKVPISIILETPPGEKNPGGLHWHLKLSLTNPFSLLEKLKEAGFQPAFESPDFWVFQILPEEFTALRSELLGAYGVVVEMRGIVEPPAGHERFPASFYIEESQSY